MKMLWMGALALIYLGLVVLLTIPFLLWEVLTGE
jgi:hypothetical protein